MSLFDFSALQPDYTMPEKASKWLVSDHGVMVSLSKGWCFGAEGDHSKVFAGKREANHASRLAPMCFCKECKGE